jgi:NAD(P)-dependent dehydrogenase (short-subunit alcohol dehydrogenase family)
VTCSVSAEGDGPAGGELVGVGVEGVDQLVHIRTTLRQQQAAAGAELILMARDAALDGTLEAIKQNGGGEATVVTADFADPAAVEAAAEALAAERRIDILVNNAGTIRRAPAADTTGGSARHSSSSTADWQHVIDVNLNSTWAVTRPIGRAPSPTGLWCDARTAPADGPARCGPHHHHRLAAEFPGRDHGSGPHREQTRGRGTDPGAGQENGDRPAFR